MGIDVFQMDRMETVCSIKEQQVLWTTQETQNVHGVGLLPGVRSCLHMSWQ